MDVSNRTPVHQVSERESERLGEEEEEEEEADVC